MGRGERLGGGKKKDEVGSSTSVGDPRWGGGGVPPLWWKKLQRLGARRRGKVPGRYAKQNSPQGPRASCEDPTSRRGKKDSGIDKKKGKEPWKNR